MTQRPPRIAVLLDHIESDYHVDIVRGVLRAARGARARVFVVPGGWLAPGGESAASRNFVYSMVANSQPDGLLVLGGSLSNFCGAARFEEWLRDFTGIPHVVVGLDLPKHACVFVDNGKGMRAAVSHLIEAHECRSIAFVRGPSGSPEGDARFAAYAAALSDHGIPLDQRAIVPGGFGREDGFAAVTTLWDQRRFSALTLDAIVGSNDDVALGVVEALTARGLAVPDDIAVVGFDNATNARTANPPLTTIDQRVEEQGFEAAALLLNHLEKQTALTTLSINPTLVARASCGCNYGNLGVVRPSRRVHGGVAKSCQLGIVESYGTIALQLSRAASGRFRGSTHWENRLLDALLAELNAAPVGAFCQAFDLLARRNIAQGGDAAVLHDVLMALRSRVLPLAELSPGRTEELEDLFQETWLLLARVVPEIERELRQGAAAHVRSLTKACLAMIGRGTLEELEQTLNEQLPPLRVPAFCISQLNSATPGVLQVIAKRSRGLWQRSNAQVASNDLGVDTSFDSEEAMVIEPLEFLGSPVGIAAFTWGTADPRLFEQLRELLSMAIFVWAQRQAQESDSPPLGAGRG